VTDERRKENKCTFAVIPCFNEEVTIGSVVLKAKRYAEKNPSHS